MSNEIPSYPGDERLELGHGAYMIIHHNGPPSCVATTVVPADAALVIPYHVHPLSSETMTVHRGELCATIDGKPGAHALPCRLLALTQLLLCEWDRTVVTSPTTNDGTLHIPAGTRHGFSKRMGTAELVFTESTAPAPDRKRDFFGDLVRIGYGGSSEVRQSLEV